MALYDNYAITISPPHRPCSVTSLYTTDKINISRILKRSCRLFSVTPEFSSDFRLHYHGVIIIKDYIKWFYKTLPILNKIGFTKIKKLKTLEDKLKWIYYCKKDHYPIHKVFPTIRPTGRKKQKLILKTIHGNILDYCMA